MASRTKKKIPLIPYKLVSNLYEYPKIKNERKIYERFGFWLVCDDKEYAGKSQRDSYIIVPIDNNIYRFQDLGWNDLQEIFECLAYLRDRHPKQKRIISFVENNFITNKFIIRVVVSSVILKEFEKKNFK